MVPKYNCFARIYIYIGSRCDAALTFLQQILMCKVVYYLISRTRPSPIMAPKLIAMVTRLLIAEIRHLTTHTSQDNISTTLSYGRPRATLHFPKMYNLYQEMYHAQYISSTSAHISLTVYWVITDFSHYHEDDLVN